MFLLLRVLTQMTQSQDFSDSIYHLAEGTRLKVYGMSFINVNKKKQNKKEPGIAVSFIRSSKYKLLQTLTNFVREGGKERERKREREILCWLFSFHLLTCIPGVLLREC